MNLLDRTSQVKTLLTTLVMLLSAGYASPETLNITVGGTDGLDPYASESQCRIGLALSGGGARGLCSVGILRAFEEKGIEVAALAGTSIGGVVGGLYACGYSSEKLSRIVREIDINALVANRPVRTSMFLTRRQEREKYLLSVRFDGWHPEIPSGWTGGQEITALLTRLTAKAVYAAGRDFTRLPIPFKTVATDIVTGKMVIFANGSLAEAMRASMAFPLAFTGVEKGDSLLMDGGMLVPVPVEIVRDMVDPGMIVVAVNTTSPLVGRDGLQGPVDIANQVTTIMTADQLTYQLGLADLTITPLGADHASTDFEDADSLEALGYRAGLVAADSILALQSARCQSTRFQPCSLLVKCVDTLLERRIREAGLEKPFTLAQLTEDLKTLVRTEPVFKISARWESSCDSLAAGSGTDARSVMMTLQVWPRPKMTEITLRFEGQTLYDDLSLARLCGFSDNLISSEDLKQAVSRIEKRYHDDGYDMAAVSCVTADLEKREIVFHIDEARLVRIDVAQNHRSRDWLVRSYFPLNRGDPLTLNKAVRGMSDLYGTELFDRVALDLEPLDSGAVMTVRVKEKKYSQMRLGWHWHDEYQSEQFFELLDDNVNGIGLEFLTHVQFGPDRQNFHTGLRLDRIFSTYLSARLIFFDELLDRNLFDIQGSVNGYRDEDRWGGAFYLGQQISRLGQVQAGLRVERIELVDHLNHTSQTLNLRTLHFLSEVETFDRYPFPTTGKKSRFDIQFAAKVLGGEVEYSKFSTSIEAYYPLGAYLNYHPRAAVGLSRHGLPPSEKFYLGGFESLAGYRESELSGEKLFVLNQELRLKLPYRFYLTGRVDYGDIYATVDDIKPEKFRSGFGVTLSFDSPLGPFEFGYGGGKSPKNRVYFSAGFRF
jgi:NTE family protein